MTDIRRRAFVRTTAAGLAASALACPGLASTAPEAEEPMDEPQRTAAQMSDVRLKAMTMERVDTHSHWQPQQAELKDIAQGLGDFTQSPGSPVIEQLMLHLAMMPSHFVE